MDARETSRGENRRLFPTASRVSRILPFRFAGAGAKDEGGRSRNKKSSAWRTEYIHEVVGFQKENS